MNSNLTHFDIKRPWHLPGWRTCNGCGRHLTYSPYGAREGRFFDKDHPDGSTVEITPAQDGLPPPCPGCSAGLTLATTTPMTPPPTRDESERDNRLCNRCGRHFLFAARGILDMDGGAAFSNQAPPPLMPADDETVPRCPTPGCRTYLLPENTHDLAAHTFWMSRRDFTRGDRGADVAHHLLTSLAREMDRYSETPATEIHLHSLPPSQRWRALLVEYLEATDYRVWPWWHQPDPWRDASHLPKRPEAGEESELCLARDEEHQALASYHFGLGAWVHPAGPMVGPLATERVLSFTPTHWRYVLRREHVL